MVGRCGGRPPNLERRRKAEALRSRGLSLDEIGRRLAMRLLE
jgi:hypothetical protein